MRGIPPSQPSFQLFWPIKMFLLLSGIKWYTHNRSKQEHLLRYPSSLQYYTHAEVAFYRRKFKIYIQNRQIKALSKYFNLIKHRTIHARYLCMIKRNLVHVYGNEFTYHISILRTVLHKTSHPWLRGIYFIMSKPHGWVFSTSALYSGHAGFQSPLGERLFSQTFHGFPQSLQTSSLHWTTNISFPLHNSLSVLFVRNLLSNALSVNQNI
jgi:hypothetical protein